MNHAQPDTRSDWRKAQDERIASEPPLPSPEIPGDVVPKPLEEHLNKIRRRPVALMGVVENGLVRPLDPEVKLPEQSRVIIVTSGPA